MMITPHVNPLGEGDVVMFAADLAADGDPSMRAIVSVAEMNRKHARPALAVGASPLPAAELGYSVAARARSRTPAVAPTYMSRVVR